MHARLNLHEVDHIALPVGVHQLKCDMRRLLETRIHPEGEVFLGHSLRKQGVPADLIGVRRPLVFKSELNLQALAAVVGRIPRNLRLAGRALIRRILHFHCGIALKIRNHLGIVGICGHHPQGNCHQQQSQHQSADQYRLGAFPECLFHCLYSLPMTAVCTAPFPRSGAVPSSGETSPVVLTIPQRTRNVFTISFDFCSLTCFLVLFL